MSKNNATELGEVVALPSVAWPLRSLSGDTVQTFHFQGGGIFLLYPAYVVCSLMSHAIKCEFI